jgi:spore germination protein YaaH
MQVLAVGWYAREWSLHDFPTVRDPLGARISFCQAVALSKTLAANTPPVLDTESLSMKFFCSHDPHNASTWQGCGPWAGTSQAFVVWFDNALSMQRKYEAIDKAGWGGLAMWQASGMWPDESLANVTAYCKEEIAAMWGAVESVFGPS